MLEESVIIYNFFTGGKALYLALLKKNYENSDVYFSIVKFMVFPVVAATFEFILNSSFPFSGIAQTICFVIFVQSSQKLLITRDPLTELNNRKSFKEFVSRKFKLEHTSNLYLIMMDGNKFKNINDTYGHVEGDCALIQIANCLQEVVPRNFLICRFGGDEFVVAGDANSDEEIKNLCNNIHSALQKANENNGKEWNVSVSIGWAAFKKEFKTIPDFIEAADKELYKNKQKL